jgi:predicted MFS family arabinose efflux permease
VPESREKDQRGSLDWLGAALATVGLGALVYGLIESPRLGFSHWLVIVTLIGGVVCFAIFVLHEAYTKNPMVPLRLFRSRDFAGANVLTLLLYAALSGTFFFFALNLIQVQGYSATAAGAALLPFVVIMFSLSRWSGGLLNRFGARLPLVVGPTLAAVGFALFALPSVNRNFWTSFLPAVLVLGFGMAITVAPLTTTVMDAVSEEQAGIASGINNAVSRTAGLLAIAVFGVVILHAFSYQLAARLNQLGIDEQLKNSVLEQRVRLAGLEVPKAADAATQELIKQTVAGAFVSGFRLLMLLSAGLALASALSSWLLIKSRRANSRQP